MENLLDNNLFGGAAIIPPVPAANNEGQQTEIQANV
jgi:hypothetical protein